MLVRFVPLLRALVVFATAVGVLGIGGFGAPALAAPDDPWPYEWPVRAPITDHFRAPASPYAPGNRGIEFATVPGQIVGSAAAGVVSFAGQVGGKLFVTVAHPDGVRTSYSFLAAVSVGPGQRVGKGQPVGVAGPVFHVGARIGDAYIDPEVLFGGAVSSPYLIARPGGLRITSTYSRVRGSASPAFLVGFAAGSGLMSLVVEPIQSRTGASSGV